MYIFTNINDPIMVHKYVSILKYSILVVNPKELPKSIQNFVNMYYTIIYNRLIVKFVLFCFFS